MNSDRSWESGHPTLRLMGIEGAGLQCAVWTKQCPERPDWGAAPASARYALQGVLSRKVVCAGL